jgi:hypothetical protein
MREHSPAHWGFAVDTYHTTVEAGLSWPIDISLISSHVQAIYIKDVKWLSPGKADGVPLGTGLVNPQMVKTLLGPSFTGPISLHTEYMKGDAAKDPSFAKASLEAFKRDLAVAKEWVG